MICTNCKYALCGCPGEDNDRMDCDEKEIYEKIYWLGCKDTIDEIIHWIFYNTDRTNETGEIVHYLELLRKR